MGFRHQSGRASTSSSMYERGVDIWLKTRRLAAPASWRWMRGHTSRSRRGQDDRRWTPVVSRKYDGGIAADNREYGSTAVVNREYGNRDRDAKVRYVAHGQYDERQRQRAMQ